MGQRHLLRNWFNSSTTRRWRRRVANHQMFAWNEFVFANTFLTSPALKTLPVGLQDFVGQYGKTDLGATFAAIVVSIVPTVLLYLFLNRRVIDGMTAGATKG